MNRGNKQAIHKRRNTNKCCCWWSQSIMTRKRQILKNEMPLYSYLFDEYLLMIIILRIKEFLYSAGLSMCACLSSIWLFATLWAAAPQAPLSMGFSRREYWSGLHVLLQGIFPTQDRTCGSCLAGGFFTTELSGKSEFEYNQTQILWRIIWK